MSPAVERSDDDYRVEFVAAGILGFPDPHVVRVILVVLYVVPELCTRAGQHRGHVGGHYLTVRERCASRCR